MPTLLIDGMLLAHRCLAKMDFLKTQSGIPTGLEFGFLRTLQSLQTKLAVATVILCWEGRQNFRKELSTSYKANRSSTSPTRRIESFKHAVHQWYPCAYEDDLEADDIIASLAVKLSANDKVYIYSNDKDLVQAIYNDNVTLIKSHESQLFFWTYNKVFEKFGVYPECYALYQAFIGDPIDNIEGVPRINKKLLADILTWCHLYRYSNLDTRSVEFITLTGDELATANWPNSQMRKDVSTFVRSGRYLQNLQLTTCQIRDIIVRDPGDDKEALKAFLLQHEIFSLAISKELGIDKIAIEDAEF
jgi:hypothetical protein